jgi:hypothetical protein
MRECQSPTQVADKRKTITRLRVKLEMLEIIGSLLKDCMYEVFLQDGIDALDGHREWWFSALPVVVFRRGGRE